MGRRPTEERAMYRTERVGPKGPTSKSLKTRIAVGICERVHRNSTAPATCFHPPIQSHRPAHREKASAVPFYNNLQELSKFMKINYKIEFR